MARDLVHGTYVPKAEIVHVENLLRGSLAKNEATSRFAIDLSPQPFPEVTIDSQLLDCFYQNAISNACKFGAHNGDIATRVSYDEENGLVIQVVNKPGQGHAELVALSQEEACSIVFPTRTSLYQPGSPEDHGTSQLTTGEGGWIMRCCARSLGGKVDISFQEDCTTLTLTCPVGRVEDPVSVASRYADWKLPGKVWGIAIEDSGMQRKLLRKFFQHCGLPDDHIIIRGETVSKRRLCLP
jgi:light-regulated signal transduction histidine kinase (bacteriophytochrome)